MIVLDAALVVMALALLVAVWRVVHGPTDADRALGVDFAFPVVIAAITLLAVRLEAAVLLDLVLVATLVGFLSTVAIALLVAGRSSS